MKKSIREFIFILAVGIVHIIPFFLIINSTANYGFGFIWLSLFGLIIAFAGLFIWTVGFFTLGKVFYILPEPIAFINKGIYSKIPHPIYLGIALTFTGLSLAQGSGSSLAYTLLMLIPFDFLRARWENKYLRKSSS